MPLQTHLARLVVFWPLWWGGVALAEPPVDLARALGDASAQTRLEAERSLLAGGSAANLAVERALGHHDYRVRRRAVRVLLRAGDPATLPLVARELLREAPGSDIRVALAWTAVRLGVPQAEAIIRAELASGYWHRRLNAASDLAALRDAGAARWLLHALRDPVWMVRLRALRGLVAIDPRPHQHALIDALGDEEAVLRHEALQALVALSRPERPEAVDGAVLQALYDEETSIRRLAARALADGVASARGLAPALAFSLTHDRDAQVRAWLTRALHHDVDEETTLLAHTALSDAAWQVRAAAAGVLHARHEKVDIDTLVRDFAGSRALAADAQWLAPLGSAVVLPKLAAVALREGAGASARALAALAPLGDDWRTLVDEHAARWILRGDATAAAAGAKVAAELGRTTLAEALVSRLGWLGRGTSLGASAELLRFGPFVRAAAHALAALAPRISAGLRGRAAVALDAHCAREPHVAAPLARVLDAGVSPDALPRLLRSRSAKVRVMALRSAGRFGDAHTLAMGALSDPAPTVRLAAAQALASEPTPAPSEALASLGPLPAPVATALKPSIAAALRARLREPDREVRAAAARALWRGGDASVQDEWRATLLRQLAAAEGPQAVAAARELAELALLGDGTAARHLVPLLVAKAHALRAVARETLRLLPAATPLLEAVAAGAPRSKSTPAPTTRGAGATERKRPGDAQRSAGGTDVEREPARAPNLTAPMRALVAVAAAHLLAERGYREGLAATLAPLAKLTGADAEHIGEVSVVRLGRVLTERLPEQARTPELRRFVERVVAPELLERWADELGRDVETRWRGTAPYNLRRQHLYDHELTVAARLFPGLHPKLLKALLFQESNFERLAGNKFDCVGLAAFCRRAAKEEALTMSEQFRDFEHDARYAPAASIRAAVLHLRRKARLLEDGPFAQYGAPTGRDYWAFVLAAYNGGHDQVGAAMEKAYEHGLELAKSLGQKGEVATRVARAHATRWDNLLAPDESPEDSPLYQMTQERYGWYRPYGRYQKMSGAEAKYHEIGQFPLDILDRAFEHPLAAPSPAVAPGAPVPAKGLMP